MNTPCREHVNMHTQHSRHRNTHSIHTDHTHVTQPIPLTQGPCTCEGLRKDFQRSLFTSSIMSSSIGS